MSATIEQLSLFYYRRHPQYILKEAHWKFCRSTYHGGRDWFSTNIFKYHKEGVREFKKRIERAYRFNHTKEVVELVQKYLFKASASRSTDAPELVRNFWKKATLSGQNIETLVRAGSTSNSLTGLCAVVVDNNVLFEGKSAMTVAEEKDIRIYAYIVDAEDVLDWAYDEDGDGELLWVKIREFVRDDQDYLTSEGKMEERVRVWTRNEWILYKSKETSSAAGAGKVGVATPKSVVEEHSRGRHDLGMVPVHLFRHTSSEDPYITPGLIDEIAYLDRTIANYLSNLDAIIQDQTFSQLAIPAQSIAGTDDDNKKVQEVGTKRIFTYDAGAGSNSKPEFIAPDPKQAGVILDVINKIINEIYNTIGLAGERTKEDNAVGIDNSSGVAKAYDFERVNSLLLSKAQLCEDLENWIVKCVMKYAGQNEPEEPFVTYPTTFDVMRLADELTTAEALQKISAPEEVRKLQMKALAKKLFQQLDKKTMSEIEKSIDTWKLAPPVSDVDKPNQPETKSKDKPVAAPKRQGQVTSKTE